MSSQLETSLGAEIFEPDRFLPVIIVARDSHFQPKTHFARGYRALRECAGKFNNRGSSWNRFYRSICIRTGANRRLESTVRVLKHPHRSIADYFSISGPHFFGHHHLPGNLDSPGPSNGSSRWNDRRNTQILNLNSLSTRINAISIMRLERNPRLFIQGYNFSRPWSGFWYRRCHRRARFHVTSLSTLTLFLLLLLLLGSPSEIQEFSLYCNHLFPLESQDQFFFELVWKASQCDFDKEEGFCFKMSDRKIHSYPWNDLCTAKLQEVIQSRLDAFDSKVGSQARTQSTNQNATLSSNGSDRGKSLWGHCCGKSAAMCESRVNTVGKIHHHAQRTESK